MSGNDTEFRILSFCREGASKKDLVAKLVLSNQQLRRYTAELVDRGLLRMDEKRRILVTTDKGLVFLQRKRIP